MPSFSKKMQLPWYLVQVDEKHEYGAIRSGLSDKLITLQPSAGDRILDTGRVTFSWAEGEVEVASIPVTDGHSNNPMVDLPAPHGYIVEGEPLPDGAIRPLAEALSDWVEIYEDHAHVNVRSEYFCVDVEEYMPGEMENPGWQTYTKLR